MRSIKFRGKRIDNGEWVYGYLVVGSDGVFILEDGYEVGFQEPDYHRHGMGCGLEDRGITDRYEAMSHGWAEAIDRCGENYPPFIEVIPESIGQYTGQKCGDVEWYEGDIFRINENDPQDVGIYVCTWIQEWCMFALLNIEMGEYPKYLTDGADSLENDMYWTYPIDTDKAEDGRYEVIGNIHDHKNLLSK